MNITITTQQHHTYHSISFPHLIISARVGLARIVRTVATQFKLWLRQFMY